MCRTSGTGYAYRTGILRFLDYVNGKRIAKNRYATKAEFAQYEKLAAQYLVEDRDTTADVIGFVRLMNDSGIPPRTISIKLAGVRQWLIENDKQFSEKQRAQIRRIKPRGGRRTNIRYADAEVIRSIIAQADVRIIALVLVLVSSGMRIGELLALTWSNLRIPDRSQEANRDKLIEIFIVNSKNQSSRRTWISREAEEALMAWKLAMPAYLHRVSMRGKNLGIHKKEDGRVFPFCHASVYQAWDKVCKAAGCYTRDEVTRRNQLNIHRLRGFFKTQVAPIVGADISELLMGHSDPYGNAYNGLPDSKLEMEYRKCENALTIASAHGAAQAMEQQTHKINFLETEVDELRRIIARLTATTPEGGSAFVSMSTTQNPDTSVTVVTTDVYGTKEANSVHLCGSPVQVSAAPKGHLSQCTWYPDSRARGG